jgi:hypothetical protein
MREAHAMKLLPGANWLRFFHMTRLVSCSTSPISGLPGIRDGMKPLIAHWCSVSNLTNSCKVWGSSFSDFLLIS